MYKIQCGCGSTELTISNKPKVRGICHCEDCRDLLDVPFHAVNAWEKQYVEISKGEDNLLEFQHPTLEMKRYICKDCGETLFNTNALDWRVVSHLLTQKNYDQVPEELVPDKHFYYGRRIIDIGDDLPKYD